MLCKLFHLRYFPLMLELTELDCRCLDAGWVGIVVTKQNNDLPQWLCVSLGLFIFYIPTLHYSV